jgi:hypothetical protein
MTAARLYGVLDSVTRRLTEDADAYRVSLEVTSEIAYLPEFGVQPHAVDAYVLWVEVSDLLDAPGGPESPELCRSVAETAAAAWDRVDQSDPRQVDNYFTRWGPRHGEDWLLASGLS